MKVCGELLIVPVGTIKDRELGNKGTYWVCSMQELWCHLYLLNLYYA